jgi:DNA-binding response OmpR family regulator
MQETILIVDDERDIIDLLKYNLQKEDFRVLIAHNGKDALAQLANKPNLVVLDVMMPDMDGWEVCYPKGSEASKSPRYLLDSS